MALAKEPITIFSYTIVALAYGKDPKYHGMSKHIDIHFHYIQDIITHRKVVLKHISTSRKMVDPLTKVIVRHVFQTRVRSLGLCRL